MNSHFYKNHLILSSIIVMISLGIIFSCSTKEDSITEEKKITFEKEKWNTKDGLDYVNRAELLESVLYSDTLRTYHKDKILETLGEPDRQTPGYFYYTISQNRLGLWPLHTRSLVIKFKENGKVEWIKTHA